MGSRPALERSLVVDRSELLARVLKFAPTCLVVVAPAGYGKTRFARLAGEAFGGAASCDVSDSMSPARLSRRIALTLLTAGVSGDGGLAAAVAIMEDSEWAESEWDQIVDAVWMRGGGPPCIVFDNFERIAHDPILVDRVARLALSPGVRRIIVCSRMAIDAPAVRRIAPNEIMRIGVADLEFTETEIRGLLATAGAPENLHVEAIRQCQGWPIAALVFAHAAESGSLAEALASAAAAENMTQYVVTQAFGGLNAASLDLLGAVARLSPASETDLVALRTTGSDLRALAANHPFFSEAGGSIVVHPLAQKALSEANRGAKNLVDAARDSEGKDPQLAARLYVAAGSQDDAARLLGTSLSPFLLDELPVQLAAVVGSIDRETLLRHPAAWANTTLLRVYTISAQQRLSEARAVWDSLPPTAPLSLRVSVGTAYYNHALLLNNVPEGDAIMADLEAYLADEPADSLWRCVALLWRQWGRLRSGRSVDVAGLRARSKDILAVPSTRAAFIWEFEARPAWFSLDRDLARSRFENALELARSTESMAYRVIIALAAAFFAWVAGEDALFQRYARMLQEDATPAVRGGVSYFLECSVGVPEHAAPKNETRYQRAFGAIIGSTRCAGEADRRALAEFAVSSASDDGEPICLTLAWLCLAFTSPEREKEALEKARINAARIEGGAWVAAIAALQRDRGPLVAFKRRFTGERVLAGYMRRTLGGKLSNARFTGREFATIVALASVGHPLDSTLLATMLFPDEEPSASLKALRVWVSRVRAKVPNYEIIRRHGNAYELASGIQLDLYAVEEIIQRYRRTALLADQQRHLLTEIVEISGHATYLPDAEWAEALYRRYQQARRDAGLVLARDAQERGETESAIALLNRVLADDPLDEGAAEMLMRLYQGIDKNAEADRVARIHKRAVSRS